MLFRDMRSPSFLGRSGFVGGGLSCDATGGAKCNRDHSNSRLGICHLHSCYSSARTRSLTEASQRGPPPLSEGPTHSGLSPSFARAPRDHDVEEVLFVDGKHDVPGAKRSRAALSRGGVEPVLSEEKRRNGGRVSQRAPIPQGGPPVTQGGPPVTQGGPPSRRTPSSGLISLSLISPDGPDETQRGGRGDGGTGDWGPPQDTMERRSKIKRGAGAGGKMKAEGNRGWG
ncbi:unnamed protein product [Boreogadus saida]